MIDRRVLRAWVIESLRSLQGAGTIVEVCRAVWLVHEHDLRSSGDLFFTWQYDIRWAAQFLRDNGYMHSVQGDRSAPWELSGKGWEADLAQLAVGGHIREQKSEPPLGSR